MHFLAGYLTVVLALGVSAAPQGAAQQNVDANTIASLTPDYGVTAGQGDDGSGNCVTPVAAAKIPCTCPPPREDFLSALTSAVQAGNTLGLPAAFPTDDSNGSEKTRLATMLSVLQNFNGAVGSGCPAIATTYKQTIDQLDAGGA